MSYYLNAFIGRQKSLQLLTNNFRTAKQIDGGNEIFIIPMTEDLYDEINNFMVSDDIGSVTYMTKNVEAEILKIIENECVGYVEAEYFGGQGGQSGLLWDKGERTKLFDFGQGCINSILKHLGVVAKRGLDEFDSIGLNKYRRLELEE